MFLFLPKKLKRKIKNGILQVTDRTFEARDIKAFNSILIFISSSLKSTSSF